MSDTENEKRLTLRLPLKLHEQIVELADQDYRSVHAEIIVLLLEAVAARAKQASLAPPDR